MNYVLANHDELPRTLAPALIRLINHHSGDPMFLVALQTLCQHLLRCGEGSAYGSEQITRTQERFSFPADESDFCQLTQDYDTGILVPEMLSGTIAVINSILASNAGIENLSN